MPNRSTRRQNAAYDSRRPSREDVAADQQWEQMDNGVRAGIDSQISQCGPYALQVLTQVDGKRVDGYDALQDDAVQFLKSLFNLRKRQADAMPTFEDDGAIAPAPDPNAVDGTLAPVGSVQP